MTPVEITWQDARGTTTGGWWPMDEAIAESSEPFLVRTVGFILKSTKDFLIVAGSVAPNGLVSEVQCIPAGMVKKVRRLK